MPKGPLLPSDFVPTPFSMTKDKADFGNALLHFIESEWKRELFTKSLYHRLSMCFGHIAHCDRPTFYESWFTSDADRLRFLHHCLKHPCWGSPEHTFCDVERAVQNEIRKRNYLVRYELRAEEALRSAEMTTLERLEAKYRSGSVESSARTSEPWTPAKNEPEPVTSAAIPVQASLF